MEKPSFESGPESEKTLEGRLSIFFDEWRSKPAESGHSFEELQNFLREKGLDASVKRVYRNAGTWEKKLYFLEDRPANPQANFLVSVQGENFLLPSPGHDKDSFLDMGILDRWPKDAFSSDGKILPVKLLRQVDRWEVYGNEISKINSGSKIVSKPEEIAISSEKKISSPQQKVEEKGEAFVWTPEKEKEAKDVLIEHARLSDEWRELNGKPKLPHDIEGDWVGYKATIESDDDFNDVVGPWKKDVEGLLEKIQKRKVISQPSIPSVATSLPDSKAGSPAEKVENHVAVGSVSEVTSDGKDDGLKTEGREVKQESVRASVDGQKESAPATPEVTREEAYRLYIEFTTLLAELNKLKGEEEIPTNQQSLDDVFDADMKLLEEGGLVEYVVDIKQRIVDIKKQIEDFKKADASVGDSMAIDISGIPVPEANDVPSPGAKEGSGEVGKKDYAKEEAEALNVQLKRELDSLLNRLRGVKNVRFVNKNGEEVEMSSSSAVRNLENFIQKNEANAPDGKPKPEEVESFLSGLKNEKRLHDDLFLYFLNKGWLRYDEKDLRLSPLKGDEKKAKEDLFISFCRFWKELKEDFNLKEPFKVGDMIDAYGLDDLFDRFNHGDELTKLDLWRAGIWESVAVEGRFAYKIVGLPAGVEALWEDKKEKIDERRDLFLKLVFEEKDLRLNADEIDYDRLDNGTEKYWVALKKCIQRYFIAPSMETPDVNSVFCRALTRLVFLHNQAFIENDGLEGFENLKDFAQFRKNNLDNIKIYDDTFSDFAINKTDLETIFDNARNLLDRKIALAKRRKSKIGVSDVVVGDETETVLEPDLELRDDDSVLYEGEGLPSFDSLLSTDGIKDHDESMTLNMEGVPTPEEEDVPVPGEDDAEEGKKSIESEKPTSSKSTDKPASPKPIRETPDWSGGVGVVSREEARSEIDRILGTRRVTASATRSTVTPSAPTAERRPTTSPPMPTAERGSVPPVPSRERPPVRPEVETEEESGPETVVVRRDGVLHDWGKKTLKVLTLGGLLFGLNYWLTKKDDAGHKDAKPDAGSSTNRIERIEKEKTPLQKLEGSLTNFVSPQYLEKIKALDKAEVVSGTPLMIGFESIKPGLEKDLEFIWNDQNGFYPRGWISGKFSTINFSDGIYDDVETPDTVKESGNKKNIGTYDENVRSINFYVNGANEISTLVTNRESMRQFVGGLDKTFAHEIGHANDWTGNWAYPRSKDEGEMTDSEKKSSKNPDYKYEKRLTLLGSIISRLESTNRLHFKAVEDIPESQKELKVSEYWASICDTYFEFPERMEKENKEDFDLVNGVVQDMDPGFNPKVAKSARYEVMSNLGKEDVTLLAGGKVKAEEFRKKVVEGLKGRGGKPRYFNAYTQTEK